MIWAPQILYILHNTPVWVSQQWFKKIDSLFRILICKGKQPRISLPILQLSKDGGGLAVPSARFYFLASQMQHSGWGTLNAQDPIQVPLMSRSTKYRLLAQLEAGGMVTVCQNLSLSLMVKVWDEMSRIWESIWKKTNTGQF